MTSTHRTVFGQAPRANKAEVVRHTVGRGWRLRAFTRDPGSRAARVLADQGVEVIQGDLEGPASFEAALRGVYGAYSVQDFWTVGAKRK